MTEDILIRIKNVLAQNDLPAVKNSLKEVRAEMNAMKDHSTVAYKQLSALTGELTKHVAGLSREQKGLSYETKMSKFQMAEWGENLTVVAVGTYMAAQKSVQLAQALKQLALEGSEIKIMREHFDNMNGGIEESAKKFEMLKKASAGNFDDKEILQYVNTMDELKYSTDESIQFLDLAERKSDELGIKIEDSNNKLIRFIETGKGKGLFQMGISISEVSKKMEELSGLTDKQIKNLDAEQQQTLRSAAVLKLYGRSIDEISQKQKDNADKIRSSSKEWNNFQTSMGAAVGDAMVSQMNSFSNSLTTLSSGAKYSSNDIGTLTGKIIGWAMEIGSWFSYAQQLVWVAKGWKSMTDFIGITKEDNTEVKQSKPGEFDYIGNQVVAYTKDGKPIFKQEAERKSKTHYNFDLPEDIGSKGSKGSSKGTDKTDEEKLSEIAELEKKILELETKRALLGETTSQAYYDQTVEINKQKEILDYKKRPAWKGGLNLTDSAGLVSDIIPPADLMKMPEKTIAEQVDEQNKINEKRNEGLNQGLGLAQQLGDILGFGADTFVGKLLNGLQQGLSLASSLLNFIGMFMNVGSGGILSIFGLAEGGYISGRGSGTSDSIPALLSNGEFVINAKSTAMYRPLLEQINGTISNGGMRYATGGMVSGSQNINVGVDRISIDGEQLNIILKRVENRKDNLKR